MQRPVVLVVDDEALIRELVRLYFERDGFVVHEASNGVEALAMIQAHHLDLVVLDLKMPELDGWEVCRRVRATSDLPILMLTGLGDLEHRMIGFNLGADDYMSKPFNGRELVAKAKVILRRTRSRRSDNSGLFEYGPLVVNRNGRTVWVDGAKLSLTRIEFELLWALVTNAGQLLSRDYLLEHVWGYQFPGGTRTVDVHVTKLRDKLGSPGERIATVRGAGYRFETGMTSGRDEGVAYRNSVSPAATVVIR